MRLSLLLCAILLSLSARAATAQTMMDTSTLTLGIQQDMQTMQLSQSIFNSMAADEMARQSQNSSAPGGKATGSRPASGQPGSTTFSPVAPTLMPQMAHQFMRDPAQAQKAEKMMNEILEIYKSLVRQKGLPLNDVARAASYAIIESYHVYYDGKELSEDQMNAIRRQIQALFATSANFQRAGNRDRQLLYENYAIVGMSVGASYDSAREHGDKQLMTRMQDHARKFIEEMMGVSINRVRFTATGIEIIK